MDIERLRGESIVLFRTDRLGDLVLSLPLVEALRARLPETRIDLVSAPANTSLARLHPALRQVLPDVYRGPAGLASLARTLAGTGYAMAVHIFPRPLQALAAFLARIPLRVGSAYRTYSVLFNRRVRSHRKRMTEHEGELNLELLGFLGIRPGGRHAAGIRVPEAARRSVRALVEELHPFVVLHAGSGGSSLSWPAEHFAALGKGLAASGWPLLLTGTEAERPRVDSVRRGLGGARVIDLCGRLDLPHLAALLSEAALTVSNSTGPLHLADALGAKVIGLYSRHRYASPVRWGPWRQPGNVFVAPGDPCRHCPAERCGEYNCMAAIRPEDVLERARALIRQESAGNGASPLPQAAGAGS